jgi:hypothetical protein
MAKAAFGRPFFVLSHIFVRDTGALRAVNIDFCRSDHMREKLAHIDRMLADHKRQENRYARWQLVPGAMTTGAALFAAGAAFMKLFG